MSPDDIEDFHVARDPIVLDREGNEVFVPNSREGSPNSSYDAASGVRVFRAGPIASAMLLLALPVILFFGFAVVLGLLAVFLVAGILMKLIRR